MTENKDPIQEILNKIELLLYKQNYINSEIDALRKEVELIKNKSSERSSVIDSDENNSNGKIEKFVPIENPRVETAKPQPTFLQDVPKHKKFSQKTSSEWEKFVGENLLNKIGIIAVVIGVTIGVKYAIEHELISPLTRIVLGYIMGVGLLGFALYLKKNYENFSAVLLSGALSILYIITFIAFSFYNLIPQSIAFTMMVLFTVFTVFAAIHYQRQIIALLGLVGAYAVPFLIGSDPGNIPFLFTYLSIINVGILLISFLKEWKWVNLSAFVFTWMIYFSIYDSYIYKDHFYLLFGFLSLFFLLFYLTLIAYKFFKNQQFQLVDIALLLINSFIFFGAGYNLWNQSTPWEEALGLFTLGNALIHFMVSVLVYKRQFADKNMFYFVLGLVLIFLTIAIPVQLDGNWVTLLWIFEATLLFWIGRTRGIKYYELLSYPLVFLAFFSLLHDWIMFRIEDYTYSVLNIDFLSAVLFSASLGYILFLNSRKSKEEVSSNFQFNRNVLFTFFGLILLLVLYLTFRIEIVKYWNHERLLTNIAVGDYALMNLNPYYFKSVWVINYSVVFFTLLLYLNERYLKNSSLSALCVLLGMLSVLVFLLQGLNELNEIQNSFYNQDLGPNFNRSPLLIGIRYLSFLIVGSCLWGFYKIYNINGKEKNLQRGFHVFWLVALLWIMSNELTQMLKHAGYLDIYKSGLSILWGVYAFILIIIGIWKKNKYVRIGAILLFGITLIKLVFYDLAELDTIPKTIVFVLLGLLLLIISFLYNKFKNFIEDDLTKD